ncbi:572_t:CDS:2, partial [Funneliformis geosporum]
NKKRKASVENIEEESSKWDDSEITLLIAYIQDNVSTWSSNKRGLMRQYDKVKQKNNQTGAARIDWKWYKQLDEVLGTCETTSPSFISDGSTIDIESMKQEKQVIESKNKRSKTSTNSIGDAILAMSLAREKMWKK